MGANTSGMEYNAFARSTIGVLQLINLVAPTSSPMARKCTDFFSSFAPVLSGLQLVGRLGCYQKSREMFTLLLMLRVGKAC